MDVLDMKRGAAKVPLKLLKFKQTQRNFDYLQSQSTFAQKGHKLLQSWMYGYVIETKAQLFHWKCQEEP